VSASDVVILALVGILAGGVNTIAGGGSLISFPALLAIGFTPLVANVTNTTGLLPGYLGGTLAYRAELADQRARARPLAAAGVAGALVGSVVLLTTPADVFQRIVPFLVLLACGLLFAQPRLSRLARRREERTTGRRGSPVLATATAFLGGVYGAYFGAGLGIMLMALLGVALDDALQRLNALKGLLSLVINAVAALIFALFGPVSWLAVVVLAASSLLGGNLGGRAAKRLSDAVLRAAVVVCGCGVAVVLLF
jgi:uncharacterized membrane protein YfcA